MTTVFFTESSDHIGGQELQLLQQARELGRRGHDAVVLCRPGRRLAQEAARQGVPVEPVAFRNALHPPSLVRLVRLLRTRRPAAVLCHSGNDSNVTALAARLAGHRPRLLRMRTYQPGPAKAFTCNRLFDLTLTPSAALRPRCSRPAPASGPTCCACCRPASTSRGCAPRRHSPCRTRYGLGSAGRAPAR